MTQQTLVTRSERRAEEAPVSKRSAVPLSAALPTVPLPGACVGKLLGLGESGDAWVEFVGNPDLTPQSARTTVPLTSTAVGGDVVLLFEGGDPRHPIVIGCLQPGKAQTVAVDYADGRLVLAADREIVLRCGDSSITLTKSGKVLINGAYVQTKASGLNRIKGAAVQIN